MLYLYKNILPNVGNNTFFVFEDLTKYDEMLEQYKFSSINENAYTYNDGVIRVNGVFANLWACTYIKIVAKDNIPRYYHVENVVFQSNFYYIYISLDLWATFMPDLSIKNIYVERCSKKCINSHTCAFENGMLNGEFGFESINQPGKTDITSSWYDNSDLLLLFTVIIKNGTASIFSNGASTRYNTYAIDLYDESGLSVSQVSCIYGSKIMSDKEYPAGVVDAYIVPKQLLTPLLREMNPDSSGTYPVRFQSGPEGVYNFNAKYSIKNGYYTVDFKGIDDIINLDPLGLYYLTTNSGFMYKIPNKTKTSIKLKTVFSDNKLNFYIICDGESVDITNAFDFTLSANDANTTALQKVQQGVSMLGNIASSVFQIASGGAGIVSGGLQLSQAALNAIGENKPRIVQGGGAGANFYTTETIKTPFLIMHFLSTEGNIGHAIAEKGGIIDYVITKGTSDKTPFKRIYNSENLPTVIGFDDVGGVYLKGIAKADNVNLDVKRFVEDSIRTGIYFKVIY